MSNEKNKQENDKINSNKEEKIMLATTVDQSANKIVLLHELKDSLVELSEKRKNNSQIQTNEQSSWRSLFEDEED